MMDMFEIKAVEPRDVNVSELDKSINHYSSLTLSIDGVKCQ
jgi:hypothetical protein